MAQYLWRPTEAQRKMFDEWKGHAVGLLVASQEGIKASRFADQLKDHVEEKFPVREMGFPTPNHFLYQMELSNAIDVREWSHPQTGRTELLIFISEHNVPQHLRHIREMVLRQAKPKTKKDRFGNAIKLTRRNSTPVRASELLRQASRFVPRSAPAPVPSTNFKRPSGSGRTPFYQPKSLKPTSSYPAPFVPRNPPQSTSSSSKHPFFKAAGSSLGTCNLKATAAFGEPVLKMTSLPLAASKGCDQVDSPVTRRILESNGFVKHEVNNVPAPTIPAACVEGLYDSDEEESDFDDWTQDLDDDDEDDWRNKPAPRYSQKSEAEPVKAIPKLQPEKEEVQIVRKVERIPLVHVEPDRSVKKVEKIAVVHVEPDRKVERILRDPRSSAALGVPVPKSKPSTSLPPTKTVERVARDPDPLETRVVRTTTASLSQSKNVVRNPDSSRAVSSTGDGSFRITVAGNTSQAQPSVQAPAAIESRRTADAVEAFVKSLRVGRQGQTGVSGPTNLPVVPAKVKQPEAVLTPAPAPRPLSVLTEVKSNVQVEPLTTPTTPEKVPVLDPSEIGKISPRYSVEGGSNVGKREFVKFFDYTAVPDVCSFPRSIPRRNTQFTLSLKSFIDYYMGKSQKAS